MSIANNHAVFFHYTLKDDAGEVLDSSDGGEPLGYLHGHGNIVEGLEREMTGKSVDDEFDVTVAPAEGYGERNDDLKQAIPRAAFKDVEDLAPGMMFHIQSPDGMHPITVMEVGDDEVLIDGNHMLAGVTLHFHVKITEIRDATEEELAHGHIHTGGCGHDH
jgi:FKBP-type peptidyl-prolyl cis-trans isomerase SlyD